MASPVPNRPGEDDREAQRERAQQLAQERRRQQQIRRQREELAEEAGVDPFDDIVVGEESIRLTEEAAGRIDQEHRQEFVDQLDDDLVHQAEIDPEEDVIVTDGQIRLDPDAEGRIEDIHREELLDRLGPDIVEQAEIDPEEDIIIDDDGIRFDADAEQRIEDTQREQFVSGLDEALIEGVGIDPQDDVIIEDGTIRLRSETEGEIEDFQRSEAAAEFGVDTDQVELVEEDGEEFFAPTEDAQESLQWQRVVDTVRDEYADEGPLSISPLDDEDDVYRVDIGEGDDLQRTFIGVGEEAGEVATELQREEVAAGFDEELESVEITTEDVVRDDDQFVLTDEATDRVEQQQLEDAAADFDEQIDIAHITPHMLEIEDDEIRLMESAREFVEERQHQRAVREFDEEIDFDDITDDDVILDEEEGVYRLTSEAEERVGEQQVIDVSERFSEELGVDVDPRHVEVGDEEITLAPDEQLFAQIAAADLDLFDEQHLDVVETDDGEFGVELSHGGQLHLDRTLRHEAAAEHEELHPYHFEVVEEDGGFGVELSDAGERHIERSLIEDAADDIEGLQFFHFDVTQEDGEFALELTSAGERDLLQQQAADELDLDLSDIRIESGEAVVTDSGEEVLRERAWEEQATQIEMQVAAEHDSLRVSDVDVEISEAEPINLQQAAAGTDPVVDLQIDPAAEERLVQEQLETEHPGAEIEIFREDGDLVADIDGGTSRGRIGSWLEDQSQRWQQGAEQLGGFAEDIVPVGEVDAQLHAVTPDGPVAVDVQPDIGRTVGRTTEEVVSLFDPAGIALFTMDVGQTIEDEVSDWRGARGDALEDLATMDWDDFSSDPDEVGETAIEAVTGIQHAMDRTEAGAGATEDWLSVASETVQHELSERPAESTIVGLTAAGATLAVPWAGARGIQRARRMDIDYAPGRMLDDVDRGQMDLTIQRERTRTRDDEFGDPTAMTPEERAPPREAFHSEEAYQQALRRHEERIVQELVDDTPRLGDPAAQTARERLPPADEFGSWAEYQRELQAARQQIQRERMSDAGVGAAERAIGTVAISDAVTPDPGDLAEATQVEFRDRPELELDISGGFVDPSTTQDLDVSVDPGTDDLDVVAPMADASQLLETGMTTRYIDDSIAAGLADISGEQVTDVSIAAGEDVVAGLEDTQATQVGVGAIEREMMATEAMLETDMTAVSDVDAVDLMASEMASPELTRTVTGTATPSRPGTRARLPRLTRGPPEVEEFGPGTDIDEARWDTGFAEADEFEDELWGPTTEAIEEENGNGRNNNEEWF